MKHLDEGTIHAWLDGELKHDAQEIERHVAACAECSERVAEARGLIAGASRILSALDDVGAGIVPARATARTARRIRPVRVVSWLAAAGVLFAVGVKTLGRSSGGVDIATPAPTTPLVTPPAASAPAPQVVAVAKPHSANEPKRAFTGAVAMTRADVSAPAARIAEAGGAAVSAAGGASQLGVVPVCVAALPAAPAMDAVARRTESTFTMFDTTTAPISASAHTTARQLRDASGAVGEWERVGADSLVVRIDTRVLRGVISAEGVRVRGVVLGWRVCGGAER